MSRYLLVICLILISTRCFSQKFFSWPIYKDAGGRLNKVCSDTIFLKDNRPILKYSKQNCSALEIANSIAISLQNNGVSTFCVVPFSGNKSRKYVLELGFFYSYLNFNVWDSRIDWQLIIQNVSPTKKFDLISKVSSERNNWGHKSGQKALVNSFEAAMNSLIQQLMTQ
jgi:hypothetical protein